MTTDGGSAADEPVADIARGYRAFARREARGRSAADEALAESVAGNAGVVDFVASLPPGKRQPQLLFAAEDRARSHGSWPVSSCCLMAGPPV